MQEAKRLESSPWLFRGRSWWLLEETSPYPGRAAGEQSPSPKMEERHGQSLKAQHTDTGQQEGYNRVNYQALFRSCVIFVGNDELLAVGTNGLDFSADGGKNWQNVKNGKTKLGWNTISQDPQTGVFWIVGSDSTVVKMYLKY